MGVDQLRRVADGFTLADVVSYAQQHNEANGENNKDGQGENYSANWGVEGETTDTAILNTRARVQRAMLASVLFAHGTPMLLAGDEFGRTQRGNNNAYCQDDEISWLDWRMLETPGGRELHRFHAEADRASGRSMPRCARAIFCTAEVKSRRTFSISPGSKPTVNWCRSRPGKTPEMRLLCLRQGHAETRQLAVAAGVVAQSRRRRTSRSRCRRHRLPGSILIDTARPAHSARTCH